jgi:hypothetical protein
MQIANKKNFYGAGIIILIFSVSFLFYAYSSGITSKTLKNGNGCTCHGSQTSGVIVSITGPDTLTANQVATYNVTISGGPLLRAGTNIAATNAVVNTISGSGLQKIGDELTHTVPKQPTSGSVTFAFQVVAPTAAGNITLYANGNSVNNDGSSSGDEWNFASNKNVVVKLVVPVELTSLSAKVIDKDVRIDWSTATEENNKGFEIQRSLSASDKWINVGFVQGSGTTTEIKNYSFIDKNIQFGKYNYRIKQIDFDGSYKFYNLQDEVDLVGVSDFSLSQNYPNPFNPITTIGFSLNMDANVSLKIYNSIGKEVTDLVNQFLEAGQYSFNFKADELTSGIYYYKLIVQNKVTNELLYSNSSKMILMK